MLDTLAGERELHAIARVIGARVIILIMNLKRDGINAFGTLTAEIYCGDNTLVVPPLRARFLLPDPLNLLAMNCFPPSRCFLLVPALSALSTTRALHSGAVAKLQRGKYLVKVD